MAFDDRHNCDTQKRAKKRKGEPRVYLSSSKLTFFAAR
jgi:hypothetical protein